MTARMCSFFKLGNCKYAAECHYAHSDGRKGLPCKFFIAGDCKFGDGCYYLHSTRGARYDDGSDRWQPPSEPTVLKLEGKTMTPEGTEWQHIQGHEAEARVRADPETYLGWCTMDGVDHGLWLLKTGYDIHSSSGFTTFLLRQAALPSTKEFECFEDDFIDEDAKRPGRGEGLKDTAQDLCLFSSILPDDIHQGSLGDCWLMSSMSTLAEFPRAVSRMFRPKRLATDGKYDITLFHPIEDRFVHVVVDDRLPVDGFGRLKYCQMTDHDEIWPCLLEKAMAKLFGGYSLLKGNTPLIALKAFTQSADLVSFSQTSDDCTNEWQITAPKFIAFPSERELEWKEWPDDAGNGWETRSIADFYETLHSYDHQNFLMCACSASKSGDDSHVTEFGIVHYHAYSVTKVESNVADSGVDLMQIRNPWGRAEWNGDWSDQSNKWEEYPAVQEALQPAEEDDGMFWISKEDFARHFKTIYVVRTSMPLSRTKERSVARKAAGSCRAGRTLAEPATDIPKSRHHSFDCHVDSIATFPKVLKQAICRAHIDENTFVPLMCVIEDNSGAKFPLGSEDRCQFPVRVKYPVERMHDERAPADFRSLLGTSGHQLFSRDMDTKQEAFLKFVGAFQQFDADGNGTISEDELITVFSTIMPDQSEDDIRRLLQAGDANHDGFIDYEEFAAWMFGR